MLNRPKSRFAALLNDAELESATRDFHAAMIAAREALDDRCERTSGHRVHALITYAQVFGHEGLAVDCRRLETAIRECADPAGAEEAVRDAIAKLLADVSCPSA